MIFSSRTNLVFSQLHKPLRRKGYFSIKALLLCTNQKLLQYDRREVDNRVIIIADATFIYSIADANATVTFKTTQN
jgi:hypothetical protein